MRWWKERPSDSADTQLTLSFSIQIDGCLYYCRHGRSFGLWQIHCFLFFHRFAFFSPGFFMRPKREANAHFVAFSKLHWNRLFFLCHVVVWLHYKALSSFVAERAELIIWSPLRKSIYTVCHRVCVSGMDTLVDKSRVESTRETLGFQSAFWVRTWNAQTDLYRINNSCSPQKDFVSFKSPTGIPTKKWGIQESIMSSISWALSSFNISSEALLVSKK